MDGRKTSEGNGRCLVNAASCHGNADEGASNYVKVVCLPIPSLSCQVAGLFISATKLEGMLNGAAFGRHGSAVLSDASQLMHGVAIGMSARGLAQVVSYDVQDAVGRHVTDRISAIHPTRRSPAVPA